MAPQKVISREYKIMLRPKLFAGDEKKLLAQARVLWRDVSKKIKSAVVNTSGDLTRIKTRRLIRFLDTRKHRLNAAQYIFRERRAADGLGREVTLKFRHADRFLAQARDMQPLNLPAAKTKFEEDIKGEFTSLHSFSTTFPVRDEDTFTTLPDVVRLFPDLADRIDAGSKAERLETVNGFTALEVVVDGAVAQVGKTPKVDAEWALIVWYDEKRGRKAPVAVELSYRYGDKDGDYGGGVTRRASDIFRIIQSDLKKWVDPNPRTKTAFVFQ